MWVFITHTCRYNTCTYSMKGFSVHSLPFFFLIVLEIAGDSYVVSAAGFPLHVHVGVC